jgi:hypothetical protein
MSYGAPWCPTIRSASRGMTSIICHGRCAAGLGSLHATCQQAALCRLSQPVLGLLRCKGNRRPPVVHTIGNVNELQSRRLELSRGSWMNSLQDLCNKRHVHGWYKYLFALLLQGTTLRFRWTTGCSAFASHQGGRCGPQAHIASTSWR